MRHLLLLLFAFLVVTPVFADGFKDDFSDPEWKSRQALRGEWKYQANVASCVADPALYKKFKNHGPILRWPCNFKSGKVEFEFKPKDVQRLVFTFNKTGHVFRIALADEKRTRIFGWAGPSKETDPATLAKEGVPTIADFDGQWVKASIAVDGDKANVKIGDYEADLKHACLAREKGEVTLSFAFGELSVRNVRLSVE